MTTSIKTFSDASVTGWNNVTLTNLTGLPTIPSNAVLEDVTLSCKVKRNGGVINSDAIVRFYINSTLVHSISNMGRETRSFNFSLKNYITNNGGTLSYSNGATFLEIEVYHRNNALTGTATWTASSISITATYTPHTHSYATEISRTPSTCCKKGSVTKQCSCGETQTTELALDSSNHSGGTELRNVSSATCTTTGYTGDTYCKGCGAKLSSGSTTNALEHSYSSVVTSPTETSDGYTTHTCSNCGHSYVDSYTCLVTLKKNNDYGEVTGGKIYNKGDTVTITATPNADCMFVGWNDGVKTSTRNITVTGSVTYTAYFKLNAIYVDDSQSIVIYADTEEAEIVYADGTTVYE